MKTIEFYFDVGSPAAYIAWTDIVDGAPQLRGAVLTPAGG